MTRTKLARIARISAGALLIHERRLHRSLSVAVESNIDQAVAAIVGAADRKRARKGAMLASLVLASQMMASDARYAIAAGRQDARTGSVTRLSVELRGAGIAVNAAALHKGHERHADDDAHGASAGGSLASQWVGLAMASLLLAQRNEEDPAAAVERTKRAMRYRIDRTASTENAQAWNEEHEASFDAAAENDAELAAAIHDARIVRIWNAILDRRTCVDCARHHGEVVGVNESFADGDEPTLHPFCRCIVVYASAADAAELLEAA